MLAELLYLQYDNPTAPVYMYINSTGVQVRAFTSSGGGYMWDADDLHRRRYVWGLSCSRLFMFSQRSDDIHSWCDAPSPCSTAPWPLHDSIQNCTYSATFSTKYPVYPRRYARGVTSPHVSCFSERRGQAGLRVGGVRHLRHDAVHQASHWHSVRWQRVRRGRHAAGGRRAGAHLRAEHRGLRVYFWPLGPVAEVNGYIHETLCTNRSS